MPDLGYRSIEVQCINDAGRDLTVSEVVLDPGSTFVAGEMPRQGDVLAPSGAVRWGICTGDTRGYIMCTVRVSGLGSVPILIAFSNDPISPSYCMVTQNEAVRGIVQLQGDPEQIYKPYNHAIYIVYLVAT